MPVWVYLSNTLDEVVCNVRPPLPPRARCGPARGRHDDRTTGPNDRIPQDHARGAASRALTRRRRVHGGGRTAPRASPPSQAAPGPRGAGANCSARASRTRRTRRPAARRRWPGVRNLAASCVPRGRRPSAPSAMVMEAAAASGVRLSVERNTSPPARARRAHAATNAQSSATCSSTSSAHTTSNVASESVPSASSASGARRDHGEARPRRRARAAAAAARGLASGPTTSAPATERAREEPAAAADVRHPLPAQAAGPRPHVVRARGVQRVQRAGAARAGRVGPDDGAELGHLRLADRRRAAQRQARRAPRCPRREACGPHLLFFGGC